MFYRWIYRHRFERKIRKINLNYSSPNTSFLLVIRKYLGSEDKKFGNNIISNIKEIFVVKLNYVDMFGKCVG